MSTPPLDDVSHRATANRASAVVVRPMVDADVPIAEEISSEAFFDIDQRTARSIDPPPRRRPPERGARWIDRTRGLLGTDADGCWVAESDDGIAGFATSIVRERMWALVTFAVRPALQSLGIGRRLLDAALQAGADCEVGLISASDDPLALRRYHVAGFAPHPQLLFRGQVDRSVLPAVDTVRDGTADDLEWIDDLDRQIRGGPHGTDHESLAGGGQLIVTVGRTAYAYTASDGCALVAGTDPSAAGTLLWECLARSDGEFVLSHVTTANRWAIDIALAARLSMSTSGYLCIRGIDPPTSYVHNGALL
jgi:GNAT superfamily N-acetyltransferase